MIYGNLEYLKNFKGLEDKVKKALEFSKEKDLVNYAPGSYEIDGDDLFVNIVEYDTKEVSERFWEAHREYIDVHVIFTGNEKIDYNFIKDLNFKEYVKKDDFVSLEGEAKQSLILSTDDFAVLYPEDAHMTALKVNGSEKVKKAIFKVKL